MKTIEQKAKNVPAIRFAGFDDEWVEKKLGDEAIELIAGGDIDKAKVVKKGKFPIYANALTNDGIVGYYDDFFRVKAPAVTITGRGEVGYAKARKENFTPVVRLLSVRSNHDSDFLENAINIHNVVVESTGVPQLTVPQISSYDIFFPCLFDEEKKLGSFFSNIDSLISLEQKKYDKLTQVKKSMLEKMFPKEGATVPEIRFAGFTGDWEKDEFSNIITVHPFKPYLAEPHIGGKIEVIQQGNDPIAGYANGKPFEDYKNVTLFGDHTVSLYKARNPFFVASDGLKILSSKKTSPNFFYHMLDRFKPIPEGYKRHFMILLERECYYPKEKTEQNLISSYLNSLDSLISLQQRKLEKLKNIKKSLLEKMVV